MNLVKFRISRRIGSGKSTAGRAAIRLIEPTEGEIQFEGTNLRQLSLEELITVRRKIQMIFQDPFASLNPRKTIGESIGESLLYHKMVHSQTKKRIKSLIFWSNGMIPK